MVVVSPDVGSVARSRSFANKMGMGLAIVDKRREKRQPVRGHECHRRRSAASAASSMMIWSTPPALFATRRRRSLKSAARTEVYACATHGVLSGPALERHGKQLHQGAGAAQHHPRARKRTARRSRYHRRRAPSLPTPSRESTKRPPCPFCSDMLLFVHPPGETWLIVGPRQPRAASIKIPGTTPAFWRVDRFAEALGVRVNKAEIQGAERRRVRATRGQKRLTLVKPETFMNASGLRRRARRRTFIRSRRSVMHRPV